MSAYLLKLEGETEKQFEIIQENLGINKVEFISLSAKALSQLKKENDNQKVIVAVVEGARVVKQVDFIL